MGINDQAKADVQTQGTDNANSESGHNEDSHEGGENSDDDDSSSQSFDDVTDVGSFNDMMEALEAGDMPELNPQSEDESDEGGEDGDGEGDDAGEDTGKQAGEDTGDSADDDANNDEGDADDGGDDDKGGDDDSGDDADDSQQSKSKRYRLRSDDPIEQRAMELRARNKDMTLRDALNRAESELGNKDSGDDDSGDDADDSSNDDKLPSSIEDTEAKIKDLAARKKAAIREDLDFDLADELDDEMRQLERHIGDLKVAQFQSNTQSQEQFDAQVDQSKAKAVELYDFVTQDGDEVKRMEEIDRDLKESGDPLYHSADKPLRLAQMVARELGIAPKGKIVKKPAQNTQGQPPRNKSLVQPASASARTAPTSQSGQLDEVIDAIDNPMDWEEAMGGL